MTRLIYCIVLLFSAIPFCASKENYEISTPVGLGEVGINKVLCMKNGNTVLFHFEINKAISIQVFDPAHKRIAKSEPACRLLDEAKLTTAAFKGLYEINGEAVLFFEQQNSGKHSLIRLRYNAANGKLIDESQVGKSKGLSKPMSFYVMKDKKEDGYAILFCQDVLQFRECDVHVSYYNARHELYRDIPLDPERKKYDYMSVLGAESKPEGICVSLSLSNMVVNGTGNSTESISRYNHYMYVFYIPRDSARPIRRMIDLSTEVNPFYTSFSHNPFAGAINLLMLSYREVVYRYGIDMRPSALISNLLFCLGEQTLTGNYSWFTNKAANKLLLERTDTTAAYSGLPVKMVTNDNGLSTVVSESYSRYLNAESFSPSQVSKAYSPAQPYTTYSPAPTFRTVSGNRAVDQFNNDAAYPRSQVYETYLGNLCITQFDDNGKEIWGTVLPKSQYYRSYRHYYRPNDLAKRWQDQPMFDDIPAQVFERQFMSTNVHNVGDDFYIIYNDCTKNLDNTIASPGDTVYASTLSNACYYKMNRKKEITKHFLLGDPLVKEYKSCFIEGSDFDEERHEYVSLVRYKRGEYVSMRMAWVKME